MKCFLVCSKFLLFIDKGALNVAGNNKGGWLGNAFICISTLEKNEALLHAHLNLMLFCFSNLLKFVPLTQKKMRSGTT